MKEICYTLTKITETRFSTVSQLTLDDRFLCFIIEDGHREAKVWGQTRIPAGVYEIKARRYGSFYDSYRKRFGWPYIAEITEVPNFTNILVHIGNTPKDTAGCLLPNMGVQPQGSGAERVWTGRQSMEALQELMHTMLPQLAESESGAAKIFIDVGR